MLEARGLHVAFSARKGNRARALDGVDVTVRRGEILAVVGELHAVPFAQGVPRVYTVLKLDERRDRPDQTLDDKVRAVEQRLEEQPG